MIQSLLRRTTAVLATLAVLAGVTAGVGYAAEEDPTPRKPDPKISETQALDILQKAFPAFATAPEAEIRPWLDAWGDHAVWNFELGSLTGAVDGMSGRILWYFDPPRQVPGSIPTGPQPEPAASAAEAKAKAEEWLTHVLTPAEFSTLAPQATSDPYGDGLPGSYTFFWVDTHDGIPVPDSGIMLALDSATLAVRAYGDGRRSDLKFSEDPIRISHEQALQMWKASANPHLVYQQDSLVYRFDNVLSAIDAATGAFVGGGESRTELEALPAWTGETVSAPLPLDDAAVIAIATKLLTPPEGARVQIQDRYDEAGVVQAGWTGPIVGATVTLNRETGMILSAWRGTGEKPMQLTSAPSDDARAQAKQAAIELVQTFFSAIAGKLRLADTFTYGEESPWTISFRFQRVENGIAVENNGLTVTMDMQATDWLYMDSNWSNVKLPPTDGLVSPAQASSAFFAGLGPQLTYQADWSAPTGGKGEYQEPGEAPNRYVKVYTLPMDDGRSHVDAVTGKLLNWSGEPVGAAQAAAALIKGHWAEGELRYLVNTGMLRPGQLDPDAVVTQAQAKAMLSGVDSGWYNAPPPGADVADPAAAVTRAQFVVWLAQHLQLGDLARSDLRVVSDFTDLQGLTPEEQKSATFLRALGLLKPVDRFRGADGLTQAEAAALVVRVLNYQGTRFDSWYPGK